MDYYLKEFKEALENLPAYFEKANTSELNEESREKLELAFTELLPKLKAVQKVFDDAEKDERDLNKKFYALTEEQQIALIEAALPDHTICPVSRINEYIQNELHGNCMKFIRALDGDYDAYNTRYFEICDTEKYFEVFQVSHLASFLNDEDVLAYLKEHPDAFDKK